MTEEIMNSDGSRNWQANILLDNIKRLEQDSKQLTQWLDEARKNADFWCDKCANLEQENERLREELNLHLYGTDDKMIHTLYGQPIQYWIKKKEALDGANSLIKGYHLLIKKYRSALEEIREDIRSFYGCEDSSNDYKLVNMIDKINEVIGDKGEK